MVRDFTQADLEWFRSMHPTNETHLKVIKQATQIALRQSKALTVSELHMRLVSANTDAEISQATIYLALIELLFEDEISYIVLDKEDMYHYIFLDKGKIILPDVEVKDPDLSF